MKMDELPEFIEKKEYLSKKTNEMVTGYDLKLPKIGLSDKVVVEKMYKKTQERNLQFGPARATTIGYNNYAVDVLFSVPQGDKWDALPLGLVEITVTATEKPVKKKGKDGKFTMAKGLVKEYTFRPVGATTKVATPTIVTTTSILDQRQINALKIMVTNGHSPDMAIMVDGQQTTYRTFIGPAVDNPSQYI